MGISIRNLISQAANDVVVRLKENPFLKYNKREIENSIRSLLFEKVDLGHLKLLTRYTSYFFYRYDRSQGTNEVFVVDPFHYKYPAFLQCCTLRDFHCMMMGEYIRKISFSPEAFIDREKDNNGNPTLYHMFLKSGTSTETNYSAALEKIFEDYPGLVFTK